MNKRAARMAVASGLGAPVQYLLPRESPHAAAAPHAPSSLPALEDRLMIAWLDLAYKSLGRIRPGKLLAEAQALYAAEALPIGVRAPETYPDRILALGVVRKNTCRFVHSEPSMIPFASSTLSVCE